MTIRVISSALVSFFTTNLFSFENKTVFQDNLLKYYSGDFTDHDGDGMTDVAEYLYGYDANDSTSYPKDPKTVSLNYDDTTLEAETDLSGSNKMLFKYNFTESGLNQAEQVEFQTRCENFLSKLLPIMEERLGPPAESFVCEIYRLEQRYGYWTSYGGGRRIEADSSWNPRLFIHELIHGWQGKYKYYARDYEGHWHANQNLSGFEEAVCEGLAYALIDEYIRSYPSDTETSYILTKSENVRWSKFSFNYDFIKNIPYTGTSGTAEKGLGLWPGDNATVNERYSIVANTYQILFDLNPNFYKEVRQKFISEIKKSSSWRPSHASLRRMFEESVPKVNGIQTSEFLKKLPVFSEEKKLNGFYPILRYQLLLQRQSIYAAYADSYRHEFWWVFGDQNLAEASIPNWIKKIKDNYNYYVPIFSEEPFNLSIKTIFGETVLDYSGKLKKTITETNPIPQNLGSVSPVELGYNKFPRGLYHQELKFPNYVEYTSKAKESYYVLGIKDWSPPPNTEELFIYIGIDSKIAKNAELQIGHTLIKSEIVNGSALFKTKTWGKNARGEMSIKVFSEGSDGPKTSNIYKRYLLPHGEIWYRRMQKFLIIDKDFDGIEDMYDNQITPLTGSGSSYSTILESSTDLFGGNSTEILNFPYEISIETESSGAESLTIKTAINPNHGEFYFFELEDQSNQKLSLDPIPQSSFPLSFSQVQTPLFANNLIINGSWKHLKNSFYSLNHLQGNESLKLRFGRKIATSPGNYSDTDFSPWIDFSLSNLPTGISGETRDIGFKVEFSSFGGTGTLPVTDTYPAFSTQTFLVNPDPGYLFSGWEGDANGTQNPIIVYMDSDKNFSALFNGDSRDNDGDGISNHDEIVVYGTKIDDNDTDNDSLSDGVEINETGSDPKVSDLAVLNFGKAIVQSNPSAYSLITNAAQKLALRDANISAETAISAATAFGIAQGKLAVTNTPHAYSLISISDHQSALADANISAEVAIEKARSTGQSEYINATPYTPDWFYLPEQGWMWTQKNAYPYIYDANSRNWMYFQSGHENPRFYNYGTKEWMILD